MTDEFLGLRKVAKQADALGLRVPLTAQLALALFDRVETAEQALQRVRELHQYEVIGAHEGYGEELWCPTCEHHWPCPTIKALDSPSQ